MCGRARCSLRADDIPRACHQTGGSVRTVNMDRYRPSYNVAPGSNLAVVRREDDGSDGEAVVLHCMKWGLIPSFTKKNEKPDHFKMFNARSESIGEKASFRRLLPKNRCLVAVEGFYEWKKDGSKRQPYYIHLNDGRPLVFAALYDSWENSEGEKLYTFTIVTTSSSSALEWLHVFVKIELPSNDMFVVSNIDRMPVILGNKESCDTWLNGSSSYKFNTVLRPYENSDLVWYPVTPAMGKPTFDGPECIKEIKLKTDGNIPISKFFFTKGSKKEAEMNPEDKSSCEKSVKTDMPKCLKEEFEDREQEVQTTVVEKEEYDLKSSVHSLSQEGPSKCQMKRAYEELSADSKLTMDETEKLITSPAKKKGNLKSAGDNKQPTLFSYFGKS